MRLRHVKKASEKIINSQLVIKDYSKYQGCFKDLFSNDNPLEIEIGMGKGQFIINKAIQNPEINYIGIEKYDSVLVRALEKVPDDRILNNLRFLCLDATIIDQVFAKEVSVIYLNFSDPWPKNRHEHRRLTSPNFLKKYDCLFCDKAKIVMKTDNQTLFEYSLKSFNSYNYKINNISLNLKDSEIFNITTEYEDKFMAKEQLIYMVEVIK